MADKTKQFLKMVQDEFDEETLELMIEVINKQLKLVRKMKDLANPRKRIRPVKGINN